MVKLYIFLILFGCGIQIATGSGKIPDAIVALSAKHPVVILEYYYNKERVFVIDSRSNCCDLGADIYNSNAEIICRYIGIGGVWEKACSDFDESAVFIRRIGVGTNGT